MSSRDFSDAHEECSTERFRKVPAGHTLLWRQGDDLNADPLTAPPFQAPFPSRLIHQSELLRAKIFLEKSRCLVRVIRSRCFVFRGEFGSTTEDPLPRERTVQALALGGTASAVGRLVVNVLTIVSTMKYEIQRWNFLE